MTSTGSQTQVRFDDAAKAEDASTSRWHKHCPASHRTLRLCILAYYVKPSDIYNIQKKANTLRSSEIDDNFFEFKQTFAERTGLEATPQRFCDYGGSGYYIVLAKGPAPQRPSGDNEESKLFTELLAAVKELLVTDKEPRWYNAPW
jgi:hypothetical protein